MAGRVVGVSRPKRLVRHTHEATKSFGAAGENRLSPFPPAWRQPRQKPPPFSRNLTRLPPPDEALGRVPVPPALIHSGSEEKTSGGRRGHPSRPPSMRHLKPPDRQVCPLWTTYPPFQESHAKGRDLITSPPAEHHLQSDSLLPVASFVPLRLRHHPKTETSHDCLAVRA